MLYLIDHRHPELAYHDGQSPIVHLEADLYTVVETADRHQQRWAFTTSNAGSRYFDDYADLRELHKIDWQAVQANNWPSSSLREPFLGF